jgi:hypothetical protein
MLSAVRGDQGSCEILEIYSGSNQNGTNIRGLLVYELSGASHHIDACLMNVLTHAYSEEM